MLGGLGFGGHDFRRNMTSCNQKHSRLLAVLKARPVLALNRVNTGFMSLLGKTFIKYLPIQILEKRRHIIAFLGRHVVHHKSVFPHVHG